MIKLIDRYVLKEFLKMLILSSASLMSIYIVIDFFEKTDDFLVKDANLHYISLYYLYKLPLINFHMMPIAMLLSTIIAIGILSKYNEITIMKGCGRSILRISMPVLLFGLMVSLFEFINNEFIIPSATERSNYIMKVNIKGDEVKGVSQKNMIWFSAKDRSIWNIDYLNLSSNIIKGINIYKFDDDRKLVDRVMSDTAEWSNGRWLLSKGKIYHFNTADGGFNTEVFENREFFFQETIDDLKKVHKKPEEMSIAEMRRYINQTVSEGFDASKYLVDLYYKFSFPLISFVMVLVGIPFSLKYNRNFGVTFGIGISIIIGFGFWVIMSIGVSLGRLGVLPPLISVWIANLLYISSGIYLLLNVRQ